MFWRKSCGWGEGKGERAGGQGEASTTAFILCSGRGRSLSAAEKLQSNQQQQWSDGWIHLWSVLRHWWPLQKEEEHRDWHWRAGGLENRQTEREIHMQWVWEELCNFIESLSPQADPPVPRQSAGKEMPSLQQSLCLYASALHAHPHPWASPWMYCLQQDFLQTMVAPRPHEISHRWKTLRMCSLWKGLCW